MPVLLTFSENYADEFNIYGFVAISDDEWKEYKTKVKKYIGDNGFEFGFGTNESIEFSDAEHYLDCFEVKKVSDEEFKTLVKLFGASRSKRVEYGLVPFYSDGELKEMKREFNDEEDDEDE